MGISFLQVWNVSPTIHLNGTLNCLVVCLLRIMLHNYIIFYSQLFLDDCRYLYFHSVWILSASNCHLQIFTHLNTCKTDLLLSARSEAQKVNASSSWPHQWYRECHRRLVDTAALAWSIFPIADQGSTATAAAVNCTLGNLQKRKRLVTMKNFGLDSSQHPAEINYHEYTFSFILMIF